MRSRRMAAEAGSWRSARAGFTLSRGRSPVWLRTRASGLASEARLVDLNVGVWDRVFSGQQDDAAHENDNQKKHEPDEVENQPERGDDAAESEPLKEEQDPNEHQDPPEPTRQGAAPDHKQPCCESKETAEDVADAIERKRHQVQRVGDARIVLEPKRRDRKST